MSISRRQFLLSTAGAAVGAIIPKFYFRALEYLERFGSPLLDVPRKVTETLYVHSYSGDDLQLFLGDPYAEPPDMSHYEYVRLIGYDLQQYAWEWGLGLDDIHNPIELETRFEVWANHDGPAAQAHHLLASLDLGSALNGPTAVGGIELVQESNMVSTWRVARAANGVSLSLLQKRLIDLGTGIQVVVS